MKKFEITTSHNSAEGRVTTESQVSIDFAAETFKEHSQISFETGSPVKSTIAYRENSLHIDGEPVTGFTASWINSSASLMCLSAALHHQIPPTSSQYHTEGTVAELNEILQNQLNLEELGNDSSYELTVQQENGTPTHLKLEIRDTNQQPLLTQIAQQEPITDRP